jgi:hypothetical protein
MSAKGVNNIAIELFLYVAALFVLLLASANIESYLSPKKVLGAETQINSNESFWNDFLSKNPDYIPGWIEIGRYDKAREIDPNYITP